MAVDEAGRVRVLTSVHTLHPEDQAVEDMLLGWRNQQLSRNRFGKYGVCKVRFGKSRRASPPKPRAVLTVFSWTPEVIQDWLGHGRGAHDTLDVFPNESGALVSEPTLLRRLRRYCEILDFPTGLDLHSLRRSYATHLLEDGWDPLFVQAQMGHEHASTTGIYTFVSSSFRTSTLRQALDRTVRDALEGRS